ncbi:MAG: hypothetical protein AAGA54_16580 [Myxococcota bacterium]
MSRPSFDRTWSTRGGLLMLSVALGIAPAPALAASADAPSEPEPEPAAQSDAAVEGDAEQPVDEDLEDEAYDEDLEDEAYDEDLENDDLDASADAVSLDLPARLPRLQRIGWYHVLATFGLATTAGLLAGLAEREEDRAIRIANAFDVDAGEAPLYADRQDTYEAILDRGQALQTSAYVVGGLAAATGIAAIVIFAVDARRPEPSQTARRTRFGPGSVEVRF